MRKEWYGTEVLNHHLKEKQWEQDRSEIYARMQLCSSSIGKAYKKTEVETGQSRKENNRVQANRMDPLQKSRNRL